MVVAEVNVGDVVVGQCVQRVEVGRLLAGHVHTQLTLRGAVWRRVAALPDGVVAKVV